MTVKFATLYNNRSAELADLYRTYNTEESMTQQSDKDETDINLIVRRYQETGLLPQVKMEALTGDFSDVGDFHDAQQRILAAKEAFMGIPAKIRDRFNNDPQAFVNFATNPENADELREMGLANALPPKETAQTATTPQPQEDDNGYADDRTDLSTAERRISVEANLDARGRREALRERQELRPNGDRKPR